MNPQTPFVPSDIADRLVREDDEEARKRGALAVALQLDHSMSFVSLATGCALIGGATAFSFGSWTPVIIAVAFAALMYYTLFVSTARQVAQAGIQPELQAAYKRLYYSDAGFKNQVDALRAKNK
ncbi:hypothetical protein [Propionivibrio sp.]|uniref:hypothetical protein n=1 Tax=Propionivibrio sp. TaxID=2212460 RepID=UPI003BF325D6